MHESSPQTHAFSVIELLVVIAIIGSLAGLLVPALGAARHAARRARCAANLHGASVALAAYITANNGYLPVVDEPLFQPTGALDWSGDPASTACPSSFLNVMHDYLGDPGIMLCPDAVRACPALPAGYHMTYRAASANNVDGRVYFTGQGSFDDAYNNNTLRYLTNLKFLDGRRYELRTFDITTLTYTDGGGDYYLLRDFNGQMPDGRIYAAHDGQFNQLYLDLHTDMTRPGAYGLTFP